MIDFANGLNEWINMKWMNTCLFADWEITVNLGQLKTTKLNFTYKENERYQIIKLRSRLDIKLIKCMLQ